jgi:hypothetical protein
MTAALRVPMRRQRMPVRAGHAPVQHVCSGVQGWPRAMRITTSPARQPVCPISSAHAGCQHGWPDFPVLAAVTTSTDPHHPAACENCHTPLEGQFCHACGQSSHNPNKHLAHAVEEVFESFWHLDGRIFHTLRDLMVPGRIARNYLAGKRVAYVQPMRLFVILTLFTFFVAKLSVHVGPVQVVNGDSDFATLTSIAQVQATRDSKLAELDAAMADTPSLVVALTAARAAVEQAAARRSAQLRGEPVPAIDGPGVVLDFPVNGKPWDAQTNPVKMKRWPAFVGTFVNHRLERLQANMQRIGSDADQYIKAILTALPGALFVLMPVFALVLRVAYIGRRIGYLEHLVVALYSHAWLLLVVLASLLLSAASGALGLAVGGVLAALLWVAVPVYLFVMQQRVYGGRVWVTALRYLLIGNVYFCMVAVVVTYAALAGISS